MSYSRHTPSGNRTLRIADQLRQTIIDGTLAPGARLAGQRELAQQHDTTLMTIRQALSILESEGLVHSEHGVGTFVTSSGLDPDALQLVSFGETSASSGLTTELRRLDCSARAPVAARLLTLPPDTPVVLLERFRLLAGERVVYQQSFLPPAMANLVQTFRPDVSLYHQLQDQFGERAAVSREMLKPVTLPAVEAALLARPAGAAAFRSRRLTLNLHGRPLVYDEALLPGDRWLLVGDRLGRRGDWGLELGDDASALLAALVSSASRR